jgi:hypothetical protein
VYWSACILLAMGSGAITLPLWAQGGPPLETDDPGTPGNGHLELNLELEAERGAGGTEYDAPNLDINYGVGDRLQLKIEVPWRVVTAGSDRARSGLGNAMLGIKWRFLESDSGRVALSTYPQVTLPGSSGAAGTGVADPSTTVLLPVELAWRVGTLGFDAELGVRRSREESELVYGLAVAGSALASLELLGECNGTREGNGSGAGLLCGIGVRWELDQRLTVLGALEAGVAGPADSRPDRRVDAGVQLRW